MKKYLKIFKRIILIIAFLDIILLTGLFSAAGATYLLGQPNNFHLTFTIGIVKLVIYGILAFT